MGNKPIKITNNSSAALYFGVSSDPRALVVSSAGVDTQGNALTGTVDVSGVVTFTSGGATVYQAAEILPGNTYSFPSQTSKMDVVWGYRLAGATATNIYEQRQYDAGTTMSINDALLNGNVSVDVVPAGTSFSQYFYARMAYTTVAARASAFVVVPVTTSTSSTTSSNAPGWCTCPNSNGTATNCTSC